MGLLADLFAEHDRIDEAVPLLRPLADAGDTTAADRMVDLLAEHGRVDDAPGPQTDRDRAAREG
ncbi:hypothetical protein [Virgisporangium aurantiacum]|uniref:Tetratricopeptide repeat-containing protein n=1 Tax=Virgisporangium aurantiacum TaxID=175570 RepID=A0A8J4E586_9ACTN|nr:hypothetical protein [Virgisporangium aurantiacum]GIJ61869.1 hypothetical protein Vau01_093850 [Virgisporangium aurantiacum]